MKKAFQLLALLGMTAVLFTACKKDEPQEPIPDSFPKKQLIEEFTGQGCGYCPNGMDFVHDFIENDTNYILVLHHYGYSQDHFTVSGSKTVTNALKVSGAPNIAINRAKTAYKNDYSQNVKGVVFHPGYLPTVQKTQFEQTTYASVNIRNTYDAASRELHVLVSGAICTTDHPDLYLTVLVKESGMIDTQEDYYKTYEGWQEFRHTNAVRAFLSEAKGDLITIKSDRRYEEQYVLTLKEKWVPENCMVVAFLSEDFQPVVQAEQQPVVSGSKGGADILYGGITPVPVSDYYPEPNATDGPSAYSGKAVDTMATANAYYAQYPNYGVTYWMIDTYNIGATLTINKKNCIPYASLHIFTEYAATPVLPRGTFTIDTSTQAGTVWAGYRDDETQSIGGSLFYYTGLSYFKQGYLDPVAMWLIADGTMTITEEGWTLTGHTRNGADIQMQGPALVNRGSANAPARIHARVP